MLIGLYAAYAPKRPLLYRPNALLELFVYNALTVWQRI